MTKKNIMHHLLLLKLCTVKIGTFLNVMALVCVFFAYFYKTLWRPR